MTIHSDDGFYWAECDEPGCDNDINLTNAITFTEATKDTENAGYKAQRINGEWGHICPACQEKSE